MTCTVCRREFPRRASTGRRPRYCSPLCREAARQWRERLRLAARLRSRAMVSRDPDEVRLLLERASWVERGVAEQRADAADGWRRASGVIDTLNAAIRADIDDTEE